MDDALSLWLADTEASTRLGLALADIVGAGDTLCLAGDLGAGKSHLARTIIQSLQRGTGAVDDVPSPTYTLVQTYAAGDLEILHADLYRLGGPDELAELGLDEAIGRALCLIEWPDRLGDLAPDGALRIDLRLQGTGREAYLAGAGWGRRLSGLAGVAHA